MPNATRPAPPRHLTHLSEEDPALQLYQRQLRCHAVLRPEEERDLARRFARTRDPAIARRLVLANLRLVARLAFSYSRRHRGDVLDLIQEGNLGLLRAVERFDPRRGARLTTFATWWIRAYMLRYLVNNRCLVRVGTTEEERRIFFGIGRVSRELACAGHLVTDEELASALGSSPDRVIELRTRLLPEVPLDTQVGHMGEERRLLQDVLSLEEDGTRQDELFEQHEQSDVLQRLLRDFAGGLGGRELAVFEERLVAEQPRTLAQLGERFGVSRERMRQTERVLLERLRAFLLRELPAGPGAPKRKAMVERRLRGARSPVPRPPLATRTPRAALASRASG